MDGTTWYFVIRCSSTVDKKGVQTVKIKTTSAEHLRFTVALTAGVKKTENVFSAFRLPPLLIGKNLANVPPGKYPFGMQVLASKNGKWKDPRWKKPWWTTSGREGQVGFSTQKNPFY